MDQLSSAYRVIAPDLYGDGKSPPCDERRRFRIEDEIDLLQPILDAAAPYHLIGHSYGGEVAVKIALKRPEVVRSLILYEPALWGMLLLNWPDDPGTREISEVRRDLLENVQAGDLIIATRNFVDYWAGAGTWENTPEQRRAPLIEGIKTVDYKWKPALGQPLRPAEFAAIKAPILVLTGSEITRAARSVVDHLGRELSQLQIIELAGPGHLGPLTHSWEVNAQIAAFLVRVV
jgi:pimeloyl-ACP methyl ester carboxylesterase